MQIPWICRPVGCTGRLNHKAGSPSEAFSLSPAAQQRLADNVHCGSQCCCECSTVGGSVHSKGQRGIVLPNQHSRMQSAGGCQKVSSPDERVTHYSPLLQSPLLCLAAQPCMVEVRICGWLSLPQKPFMGMQRHRKVAQKLKAAFLEALEARQCGAMTHFIASLS